MKKYILLTILFATSLFGQNDFFFFYDDNVDVTPPDTVENLLVVGGVGSITLTWDAVVGVYKYYIYAGTSANPTSLLDSVATETWDTTGLVGGTVNHFRVKAGDASWNLSSYSESKSDTVLPVIPVLTVVGDVNKITITHTGIIADSIRIFRGTSANPTTWVYSIAANSTKIDTPLTAETIYHYRAKALTGSTLSDYSVSVNDTVLIGLGSELCENVTFDSDTWWTGQTGNSIADGVGHYVAGNNNEGFYKLTLLTVGLTYRVVYEIKNYSSGATKLFCGASGILTPERSANGSYSETFIADGTYLQVVGTSTPNTFDIDNVSIKQVLNP